MIRDSSNTFPDIVIVDDVPDLVRVYEKFFEVSGLKVIASFFTAKDMLEFFSEPTRDPIRRQRLDNSIVLLDYRMPEMNGEEAARILRKQNPRVKIILATGEDLFELKIEESLFDGMIQKPFSMEDLIRVIRKVSPLTHIQGSRVLDNSEEIAELVVEIISDAKEKLCVCGISFSASRPFKIPAYKSMTIRARVMFVTEITSDNLFYCKKLISGKGIEIRHLDGLELNLMIADEKHMVESMVASGDPRVVKQLMYSNVESVVNCNQYLFDAMWARAVPAEQKIRELEIENKERNYVKSISGVQENLIARIFLISNSSHSLDACYDSTIASNLFFPEIMKAYSEAIARGVKSRHITEITKEDLRFCKELIQIGIELRHLPNVVGGFAVNDTELDAKAASKDSEGIYSNYPLFVEQHRSIFNILWDIAIPASSKIKELEEETEKILAKKLS